jgi:hypothetical protein
MFTISNHAREDRKAINAEAVPRAWILSTGGDTKKTAELGHYLTLPEPKILLKPQYPDLWFLYQKPDL